MSVLDPTTHKLCDVCCDTPCSCDDSTDDLPWERVLDEHDNVVWDYVPGEDDADMPPAQRMGGAQVVEDIDDLPF